MKKVLSKLIKKIIRVDKEKIICFNVSNFEAAYKKDAECMEKAERELPRIGAFAVRVDWPTKLFFIALSNKNVKLKSIQDILKKYGFKAKIKTKGKSVYRKNINIFPRD